MIDKGLYKRGRVGLRGGADAATASFAKSAGFGQKTAKPDSTFNPGTGGGGPTFGDAVATQVSGDDGRRARQEFIKSVQKTNPRYTGGPSRDSFLKRAISGGIGFAKRNPLQILLGAINPVFGAAMLGANFLNKPQFRERFTGYETQAEYDQARQDRINRNTIATLENTIQKKYLDKGRSLTETDLDERLASLKEAMGIQDTAPNVMTGRDLNLRGIETLNTGNQDFNRMFDVDKTADLINARGITNTGTFNRNTFDDVTATGGGDFPFVDLNKVNYLDSSNFQTIQPFGTVLEDEFPSNRLPSFIETPQQQAEDNFLKGAMAELTDKQKRFIDSKKFPLQENLITPQSVYDTITNPDLGIYDTGTFGFGAQEPTTEEEYNDYLRSLGLTQTI